MCNPRVPYDFKTSYIDAHDICKIFLTQHDKLSQVKEELSKEAELYYTIVNECNLLQKYMNEIGKYIFTTSRIQKDEPNYKDAILIENKHNID